MAQMVKSAGIVAGFVATFATPMLAQMAVIAIKKIKKGLKGERPSDKIKN